MNLRSPRVLSHLPDSMLGPVREANPDLEIVSIPGEGALPPALEGEVLLTLPWGTPNLAAALACGVDWVHTYGTGVNGFPFALLGGRQLTCARGASAKAISEWVVAVLLAAEKQLPERWMDSPPAVWNVADLGSLDGRSLGLIGYGGIGQAIAARALPFGMRVRALRRTQAPSGDPGVEIAPDLASLLSVSDHVVIVAPETPDTHRMMNDAAFAAMKPGAHLVNVARGGLVDQEALRRALDAEQLALATLDCVEPEPLPEGHWLYAHPKVRLTPHISWSAPDAHGALMESFLANLARYRKGEPLGGVVDPEAGY